MRYALAFVLSAALLGCGDDAEGRLQPVEIGGGTSLPPTPPPTPPAEPAEPAAEGPLVRRERSIMSTLFQVTSYGMDEERAAPLLERALDEIARLEAVLSEWQDTSEISRVNAAAGRDAVTVGPETLAVVTAGLEVSRHSSGAFDMSWAALRGLYTFQPGEERLPALADMRARLQLVDWQQITVEGSTVRLGRPGMTLGTGGIGKGYALDRAGAILRDGGMESFMLFGGGQVQVHGMRGDRPWRVGIQHPRDPATYIGFLEATSGSISTSGDYEHAFVDAEGRHWHHIIDLSTGLPANRSMQVTLQAESGLYADAYSTAAFVLGPERALEMIANAPIPMHAVIIGPDLRVHTTPGLGDRFVMRVELDEAGRLAGDPAFGGWRQPASPVAEEGRAQ